MQKSVQHWLENGLNFDRQAGWDKVQLLVVSRCPTNCFLMGERSWETI